MLRNVLILVACLTGVLAGCSGDTTGTAPTATTTTYFSLVLDQHAINMAVTDPVHHSNTIQLTTTARNASGELIPGANQASFRLADTTDSSVRVSASGLVTARAPTHSGGTLVVATMQQENVTHVDTAIIRVTATAPSTTLTSFSLHPEVPDSLVYPIRGGFHVLVSATDNAGQIIPFGSPLSGDNIYAITSSNPWKISLADDGSLIGLQIADTGHVTLYATSWVYGIPVRDSLKLFGTWPMSVNIVVNDGPTGTAPTSFGFLKGTQMLGVGAIVTWVHLSHDTLDVVFDDSAIVDSALDSFLGQYSGRGNIHFAGFGVQARSFSRVGTYDFHNRSNPLLNNVIYIRENPTP